MVKYILCLDGGGVKGIATLNFLALLEQKIGPLHKKFDMIAGTSIGSLIGAAVATGVLDCCTLTDIYKNGEINQVFDKSLWDEIVGLAQFKPIYDGEGKREVINKYLGETKMGDMKTKLLITTYNTIKRQARFFKSWREKDKDLLCGDAVDASSAAPGYFPSIAFNDNEFIDGGVIVNNPSMCALADALKMWKGEEIKILNVGTCHNKKPLKGVMNWGLLKWICSLFGVTMDESYVEYQCEAILGENYLKINSDLGSVDDEIDNTDSDNIDALEKLGEEWWDKYGEKTLEFLTVSKPKTE